MEDLPELDKLVYTWFSFAEKTRNGEPITIEEVQTVFRRTQDHLEELCLFFLVPRTIGSLFYMMRDFEFAINANEEHPLHNKYLEIMDIIILLLETFDTDDFVEMKPKINQLIDELSD